MRAYERLINYVKINTTSSEETGLHPSFEGEFDLANILKEELTGMGLSNVYLDEKCYLYAMLPATKGYEDRTPIGFIAHMDTSPSAPGKNVTPILHENYDGGDVYYSAINKTMKVCDFPELKKLKGETLITSDGTTLLGSDDKAGIAEIITAIEEVINENVPHGTIYVAFTPDEEIGEGADYFDLTRFAAEYAYTVDGGDYNCIEYENFNAASAIVMVNGLSVHPGDAKDKMINAILVAMEYNALLPENERPENTQDREGFYHLTDMEGDVSTATLKYIIRDHDRQKFEEKKQYMLDMVRKINSKYPDETVSIEINDSYYNMLEKILPHMHIIENAKRAISMTGAIPEVVPIRGGTDGARLSFDGLPCPNLGTGGFNFHGPFEFNSVERMDKMVEIIKTLIKNIM